MRWLHVMGEGKGGVCRFYHSLDPVIMELAVDKRMAKLRIKRLMIKAWKFYFHEVGWIKFTSLFVGDKKVSPLWLNTNCFLLVQQNLAHDFFLPQLPLLGMSLETTATFLMKATTKWCWWSGDKNERHVVVSPLSAFTGSQCSGMIWRWGREKLLHNAATPPYQLTNRPGLKATNDFQKTIYCYSRINYLTILEIQIVRRKNPDMLRVWECSGQQKVKPQTLG